MSKRRPSPWVPLSIYYYDDDKVMQAGEFAEVLFLRMMAYAGRHLQWNGSLPRLVVLTRLGVSALEGVPESVPEARLEALLESGLVEAQGPNVRLRGWLNWNEAGEKRDETKANDRNRKRAATRADTLPAPDDVPESAPEVAPKSGTVSGAQEESREDETREDLEPSSPAVAVDGIAAEFDQFWQAYPRKVGKAPALKAFRAARKKVDLDVVGAAFRVSSQAWQAGRRPLDRIPHPATWLNSEPWHDDPSAIALAPGKTRHEDERDDLRARMHAVALEFDQQRGIA